MIYIRSLHYSLYLYAFKNVPDNLKQEISFSYQLSVRSIQMWSYLLIKIENLIKFKQSTIGYIN